MSPVRLDADALSAVPPDVAVPGYDRASVDVGIVHFGVGGFHRAHQAVYLDDLMKLGSSRDWGICGVGVMPGDVDMKAALEAQDCLYIVLVKFTDGTMRARVVGSIVRYLFAPDDRDAVFDVLEDPRTRIVSLTITEGGYNLDDQTGDFDVSDAGVQFDVGHPNEPTTAFGFVVEALRRRRDRGIPPFTVASCDNPPGNGDVARMAFGAFADLRDPGLGAWLRADVAFPNSMVDGTWRGPQSKAFCADWPTASTSCAQRVLPFDASCSQAEAHDLRQSAVSRRRSSETPWSHRQYRSTSHEVRPGRLLGYSRRMPNSRAGTSQPR